MAINKAMRAALKALSYPDFNETKNYKLHRQLIHVTTPHYLKPFYTMWDHEIKLMDHSIPVRIFSPKRVKKSKLSEELSPSLLLFFHGGGWVTGDIDSYSKVCADMARITNRIVVSVDYRLAPEYRFPAAVEDCYAVAREIFLNENLFHVNPRYITIIGDSAGGNLAAAVSLMARDRGEFFPESQILIYPATYFDHGPDSPFPSVRENGTDYLLTSKRINEYMELYISTEEDFKNPYLAPLLAENLSGQPKTLIITAEYDPLRDEGEAYGKKLKQFGNYIEIHRISNALHGFFSLPPRFIHVKKSYEIINHFLDEVIQVEEA